MVFKFFYKKNVFQLLVRKYIQNINPWILPFYIIIQQQRCVSIDSLVKKNRSFYFPIDLNFTLNKICFFFSTN